MGYHVGKPVESVVYCLNNRHQNFFFSSVATNGKDGNGLKLDKLGQPFSSFYAMPAKFTKKLLRLVFSDEMWLISSV